MTEPLRSPYPYFGGKRRVADVVWRAFGQDVPNFIDPAFGSNSILLARPGGAGKIETINDADRMVANCWRALLHDPWGVAEWCDGPVNEADLHAVHVWLVEHLRPESEFRDRMHRDPDYFDVKIAGRWLWGMCCWIGGGWCVEPQNHKHPKLDGIGKGVHSDAGHGKARNARSKTRPRMSGDHLGDGVHSESARTRGADRVIEANRPELAGAGKGVHAEQAGGTSHQRKRPVLDGTALGRGVHSELSQQIPQLRVHPRGGTGNGVHSSLPEKMPMLAVKADGACAGRGVNSDAAVKAYSQGRRPQLSSAGQGVHLPGLGNDRGVHGVSTQPGTFLHALRELSVPDAPPCFAWFQALMLRMRRVRVACGDWTRVLGDSVLGKGKNVGGRRPCAVFLDPPYGHDVRNPYLYAEDSATIAVSMREWALEHGDDPDLRICLAGYFSEHAEAMAKAGWTVHRWKGSRGYAAEDNENRAQETLWFSKHCLPLDAQRTLFNLETA